MYWNISAKQFMSNVLIDCNQYIAQALFTDSYLYWKLNNALFYILNFRKRQWNVQVDILGDGLNELSTYTLSSRPKLIEFVKSAIDKDYKKLIMITTSEAESKKNWHTNSWTSITIGEPLTRVHVQYEKYFERYTTSNVDTELPIPPEYNEALELKFLSSISWIWLGEGMGNLLAGYRSGAVDVLTNLSKTDTYENPVDQIKSKIFANQWAV